MVLRCVAKIFYQDLLTEAGPEQEWHKKALASNEYKKGAKF